MRGTICEVDYFHNDALRGSAKLRDALFRFAGYHVPRKRVRKPVAPTFVALHQARRGRPKGAKNKAQIRHREIETIKRIVAQQSGISKKRMTGLRRVHEVILARHVAMYVCRKGVGASYPVIGQHFKRDHTTVISAIKSVEKAIGAGNVETILLLRAIHRELGK